MKRVLTLLATMVVLAGCSQPAVGAGQSGSPTLPSPTIGLTFIPNVQFSPFYLADADGKFAAAGVAPELRHHGTSEGLFTSILAGKEQFVVAGGDEMLQARGQGADLVAVATYFRSYPVEVIVPEGSPIRTLADLKGRSIGLPGKFGENWFGLQVALRTAGLKVSEVKVQEIGYTQQAALSTGKVDAIVGFSNNEPVQFALSGFATRSLPITTEGATPLVGICLVTTSAYAKDNPEVVRGVAAGMLSGIRTAVADPDHAMEVSAAHIPGLSDTATKDSAKATLAATAKLWTSADGTVEGTLDAEAWTAMADFMAANGITDTRLDPKPAFSNAYLDQDEQAGR